MSSLTRIYTNELLSIDNEIELDPAASSHLLKVLRLKIGDQLVLFNGNGGEYLSEISNATKKIACITPVKYMQNSTSSSLDITLCQALAKGERVDFAVQKGTELGINNLQLLYAERCQFGLKGERADKKILHWQKIAISACEQSGRDKLPTIIKPIKLQELFDQVEAGALVIIMDTSPDAPNVLPVKFDNTNKIYILVGPEGGFSPQEVELAISKGALGINLGSRVLRTETAGLALISILQHKYGDFKLL